MTGCKGRGLQLITMRNRRIADAVAKAVREGIKGVVIRDDEQVKKICAEITTKEEGALKRPDLMYVSTIQKKNGIPKRILNLTEITSLWPWEDSLDREYKKKLEKYEPIRQRIQRGSEYEDVKLHIIIVTPTGVSYQQSLKEFAAATHLPRNRLAFNARNVVDAAVYAAYEHYRMLQTDDDVK
jgi:hypothetical protein